MKRISKQLALLVLVIFAGIFIASCEDTKRHNVTFDANGGTLTGEAVVYVNAGDKVSKPTDPTLSGYRFTGWYVSDDEGETLLLKWEFETKTVDTNIVLYAGWEEIIDEDAPLTILEVLGLEDGDEVITEGVVYFIGSNGFYISDGDNNILVDYESIVVTVGDKLLVEGLFKKADDKPMVEASLVSLLEEDQEPLLAVEKSLAEVAALNPDVLSNWYGYFKVSGKLNYNEALDEYKIVSEDLNDELVLITEEAEALLPFLNERIKVDVLLKDYDSFSSQWKVLFSEDSLEEFNYTEAELRVKLEAFFNREVETEILGGGLNLPALMEDVLGLTIKWESNLALVEILEKEAGDTHYKTLVEIPEVDTDGMLRAKINYKDLDEFEIDIDILVKTLVKTSLEEAINEKAFRSLFDAVVIGFAEGQTLSFKSYIVQDLDNPSVFITVDYDDVDGIFGSYLDDVEIGDILTFTAQYRDSGRPTFLEVETVATGETKNPVYNLENAPVINTDTWGTFPGYNSFVKLENPYMQYSTSAMPGATNWVRLSPRDDQMTGKFGTENSKTLAFLIRPLDALMGSDWRMDLNVETTGGTPVMYDGSIYGFVIYESNTYFQFIAVDKDHFVPSEGLLVKGLLTEQIPNRIEEGNLDLLTEHDVVDGLITWTSNNVAVIDETGKIEYPEVDTTVSLTATFKTFDSEEEHTISFEVVVVGQERIVLEVEDVLLLDDGEYINVGGYVLKASYTNSTNQSSTLNEIIIQDRNTGQLLIILDLVDAYTNEEIKVGYEIELFGQVEIDSLNKVSVRFLEDLRVINEDVLLHDYKDNAIALNSHEDALTEFGEDFHFGQVYKFSGELYYNSTTSSGRVTNLRFHINANAVGSSEIQMGGRGLVFNVDAHTPVYGENFLEDVFGVLGNPGPGRPGTLVYADLYFMIVNHGGSYFYALLLDENDFSLRVDEIVEHDVMGMVPTELLTGDLTLPVEHELLDGPITWVSDNEAVIDETGKVTYPSTEETVTLTFSFDHNGESFSYEIEILVKAAVAKTVNQIIDEAEDGDVVYVEGIVVGFHWNGSGNVNYTGYNGIILKDATGNELLYVLGMYENYGETRFEYVVGEDTLAKGDKISLVANYEISTTTGHANRKTLIVDNAENANLQILEREVEYTFELDEAIEVTGQEDLQDIAENLPYGTLFKLTGDFGFRGSASTYGTGVNLQVSYVRGAAADYNMTPSWGDRGQRFSFKFDGNVPNLGANWYEDLLGINSTTYTGTAASGMTFVEDSYIYFYLGFGFPTAATANGYIQLVILDEAWINATLK